MFKHSMLLALLCLVSCNYIVNASLGEDEYHNDLGTIVLANVIYRHGDRTPIDPYPFDPYKNLSYWPVGWGQLTNTGKEQHYELGQWLRRRYSQLLSDAYSKEDIQVRSTDVDRTLMSAASNLAGLYPPVPMQQWNKDVKWQPIPIHTLPEQLDEVLAAKKPCPRYDTALQEVKNSPAMQKINMDNAELYNYLSRHSGKDVRDIQGVEYIFNTLFIETLYKLPLPDWTDDVYPKKMVGPAALSFSIPAMTKELQRLKSGPLLGEIIQRMGQKSRNRLYPDRKMFMYSGHDTTVANMLMTLGVFELQNPPYTATIMIELRKSQERHNVMVWYRNTTVREPYLLTIPGCSALCPLKMFISLTEDVVPRDWSLECSQTMLLYGTGGLAVNPIALIGLIISAVLAIMLIVCFTIAIMQCRQQRKATYNYHQLPASRNLL